MTYKVKIIVNPKADLGRGQRKALGLRSIVEEFGGADWVSTGYPAHATELARQTAHQGYDLVISAGGDGTVHEVINGLMTAPSELRPKLGVVPLGSGNDFSYAIGMDSRPIQALQQIYKGKAHRIDLGRLEDDQGRLEYWDNGVGLVLTRRL